MSYKAPTFQDRAASAAAAKKAALEKLRGKPKLSEAELAERKAQRLAREAEEAAAREAKRAALEAEKAAAEQARLDQIAAEEAEKARLLAERKIKAPPTAAELKALRDARYAARKARNK